MAFRVDRHRASGPHEKKGASAVARGPARRLVTSTFVYRTKGGGEGSSCALAPLP